MPTTFTSRIPAIIAALDDKLIEGVEEVAEAIADGARERVPVDSGALRDAIHVEVDGMEVSVVAGDDDAFYGHIVEHGGTRTPAHPFLIPAYESERSRLEDIIGPHIEEIE